ncbi:MAG: sn-glycerol-3-phosphate ABC transporter ATP-binding protein UgpC [Bacilli bacterium]|nr:sn-glycerol-3-phosphate ABC transporter ATP-binding protein UgpC [Bacilli bacterium]
MAIITFKNVNKVYDNRVRAVFDFNLDIKDKQFVALVGPSGCGKSTTLRMIAGLEEITSGEIFIDDACINSIEPKDRGIAMVFQNYALYPHMSVRDNMSFALEMKKVPKEEREKKVIEAAKILGLENYLDKKPKELSGGQRQRVALGRAIVREPKVFLMDEPLSNLDAKLRASMRNEIRKIHNKVGATTIYVTHDQIEAMTMADVIVIMKDGFVQQIGTPTEVYNNPNNLFVAGFIGTPQMNFINAELKDNKVCFFDTFISTKDSFKGEVKKYYEDQLVELRNDIAELENLVSQNKPKKKPLFKRKQKEAPNPLSYESQLNNKKILLEEIEKVIDKDVYPIKLGVRPDDIVLATKVSKKQGNRFTMNKSSGEMLGHDVIIHLERDGVEISIEKPVKEIDYEANSFELSLDLNSYFLFDPITGLRLRDK